MMAEFKICVLILAMAICSLTAGKTCPLKFNECSGTGKLYTVQINETCQSGGEVALLKKGTKVQLNFTFSANQVETDLQSKVHGYIGIVPVPFPLANPDGCKDSGLTCPIQANKNYTLSSVLDIKSEYPAIEVKVKWELQDKGGKDIFCMSTNARIVS